MCAGLRVTSPLDTLFGCASVLSFEEGLVVADSALRLFDMDKEKAVDFMARKGRGRRGLRQALEVMSWADARSENGGESAARAVMIEEGFVVPELQVELVHPLEPWRRYRADYLWKTEDGGSVIGELDGMVKLANGGMLKDRSVLETLRQERQREALLTADGMRVLRFTPADVRARTPLVRMLERYGIPKR